MLKKIVLVSLFMAISIALVAVEKESRAINSAVLQNTNLKVISVHAQLKNRTWLRPSLQEQLKSVALFAVNEDQCDICLGAK